MNDEIPLIYKAQSNKEWLQMREQWRENDQRRALLASEKYFDQVHVERMDALRSVVEYGKITIRSLFIINGGSIVALFAFLGSLLGKDNAKITNLAMIFSRQVESSFYWFAGGVVSATAVAAVVYLNWSANVETNRSPEWAFQFVLGNKTDLPADWLYTFSHYTAWTSIALGSMSLICFIMGCVYVGGALSLLGLGL